MTEKSFAMARLFQIIVIMQTATAILGMSWEPVKATVIAKFVAVEQKMDIPVMKIVIAIAMSVPQASICVRARWEYVMEDIPSQQKEMTRRLRTITGFLVFPVVPLLWII